MARALDADASARLLAVLPDEPAFVDLRGLLMRPGARAWAAPDASWGLIRTEDLHLVSVQGNPPAAALAAALGADSLPPTVFVLEADAPALEARLPGWSMTAGWLYTLPPGQEPRARAHPVRPLLHADLDAPSLPADLREELRAALAQGPVMAALDAGLPISFCYAHHRTARWWDVSIDTLARHRRRGFAASAAAALIRHLRAHGLQPVWGALDDNPGSSAVARALGFVPHAQFRLFHSSAARPGEGSVKDA